MQQATVADALILAAGRLPGEEARAEAEILLAHSLGKPRSWLYAHANDPFPELDEKGFRDLIARRIRGEPVAHILGAQEFWSLPLVVTSDTLIPRPETERLVELALERLASDAPLRVLDLGTGSGAIALAVKQAQPTATVLATDLSAAALGVARANANRLALDVEFIEGSWWQAVPRRRFHLVLSNPPYIAGGDEHLAALSHEPTLALTPGGDGLDALSCIVAGAAAHLEPGGWLLLEHGFDQGDAVQALLHEHGFGAIQTRRDLAGRPRCTGAHQP